MLKILVSDRLPSVRYHLYPLQKCWVHCCLWWQQHRQLRLSEIRKALIAIASPATTPALLSAVESQKERLFPILPYIQDPAALTMVQNGWNSGSAGEQKRAFDALVNWQNGDAVQTLFSICKDKSLAGYHTKAFAAYVRQVMGTRWPDDQKLLKLREIFRWLRRRSSDDW